MKLAYKEYLKRVVWFVIFYVVLGLLFGEALTRNKIFVLIFASLIIPYLISIALSLFKVTAYLFAATYSIFITYLCLFSAMSYTLLPPANAMHYYALATPWNYIAWVCTALPTLILLIHMLRKGMKSLDEVAHFYIIVRKKISLEKREYYMNQKINVLKDITKFQISNCKFENFLERHTGVVSRLVVICYAVVPTLPVFLSRVAGQQPTDYLFLLFASYLSLLYSFSLACGVHTTRTVIYIQKKHNIKLKLAYKKDVIIV